MEGAVGHSSNAIGRLKGLRVPGLVSSDLLVAPCRASYDKERQAPQDPASIAGRHTDQRLHAVREQPPGPRVHHRPRKESPSIEQQESTCRDLPKPGGWRDEVASAGYELGKEDVDGPETACSRTRSCRLSSALIKAGTVALCRRSSMIRCTRFRLFSYAFMADLACSVGPMLIKAE